MTFVLHSLEGGGAERVAVTLVSALARRGFSVELFLCSADGPLLDEVPETVDVLDAGVSSSLQWRQSLEEYFDERNPRVACCVMIGASIVTLWAKRRTGSSTRVVATAQNTFSRHIRSASTWKERLLTPWLVRWLFRGADGIIAVSGGVADDLARVAWLDRDRIQVVPNPVISDDLANKASASVPDQWPRSESGPVVLAAGRLTEQKDFPTLLRAWSILTDHRAGHLVILGEGELRTELGALATALGIRESVHFPGFVTNPYAWFARADLFVLSSAWEGFGNVLVEAMACGCPVVSTDCPSGPREILEDGRYGALVPAGNASELARAMSETLDDPPEPEHLKSRAMDFHVDRIADAYARALGLASGPDRDLFAFS